MVFWLDCVTFIAIFLMLHLISELFKFALSDGRGSRSRSSKNVVGKSVTSACKFEVESKNCDSKRQREIGLVGKVSEFKGKAAEEKFGVQECVSEGRGSPRARDDVQIKENEDLGEVEVVGGLGEKTMEENSSEGKVVKVNELKGKAKHEIFYAEEFVSEGCGSPKASKDVGENEQVYREVEVIKLEEKTMKESSSKIGGVLECEENLTDKSPEKALFSKVEIELVKDEVGVAKSEKIEDLKCEGNWGSEIDGGRKNEAYGEKEGLFDDEDDWEGIETTELEKLFGAAVVYAWSRCNADQITNIGSDVKLQLYGLHKVATEGPCREPQPMALKVSARAKWNAWQKLGDMSPEVAMDQYITLLSSSIPGWLRDDLGGDGRQVFADAEASGKLDSDSKTLLQDQPDAVDERTNNSKQFHGNCSSSP